MKVIWTRKAQAQRQAIWLYLADRSISYADRVERRFDDRVASLGAVPRQGRSAGRRGERRLSLTDIRYVIDYRIDEDAILVLRVCSTAQGPEQ